MTAKELAKILNLSAAAVSMALNNKPGVSEKTRQLVLATAEKNGFDYARFYKRAKSKGTICFILYRREGAVVGDTQFFSSLTEGIETGCKASGWNLRIYYVHKRDGIKRQLAEIINSDCSGIILLGTEMTPADYAPFDSLRIPIVLLDVYFNDINHNYILINNVQGAFLATDYLISRVKKQPGYLHSSYNISNFEERADGFFNAIRNNGMSTSKSIIHRLTPNVEGAYADMLELLNNGEEIAPCYFADNDFIAIGAMRALQSKGIKIPDDVSIIGFDNVPISNYVEPSLTTINVPKQYMGEMATKRLFDIIQINSNMPVKIEIATKLIKRRSVI